MSTVRCRLSLALHVQERLPEAQQYKLLVRQCRRAAVGEWEIAALVEICRRKGWAAKGLVVAHSFAGCVDELADSLSLLQHCVDALRRWLRSGSEEVDDNALLEKLLCLCVSFLRLCFTLCRWRKLQWTPRPVSVEEKGLSVPLSEHVAAQLNRVVVALSALCEKRLKTLRKIPVELLTLLLSSVQMYEGVGELHSRLSTGGTSLSSVLGTALHTGTHTSSSGASSFPSATLSQEIARAVMDIFNMEDLIDEKWKQRVLRPNNNNNDNNNQFHSHSNDNSTDKASCSSGEDEQLYPSLCIPYPSLRQNKAGSSSSPQGKWFVSSFASYDRHLRTLRALATLLLDAYPRVKASELLCDGLRSLLDERQSTAHWLRLCRSFSPPIVLQSLLPVVFRSLPPSQRESSPEPQEEEYEEEEELVPTLWLPRHARQALHSGSSGGFTPLRSLSKEIPEHRHPEEAHSPLFTPPHAETDSRAHSQHRSIMPPRPQSRTRDPSSSARKKMHSPEHTVREKMTWSTRSASPSIDFSPFSLNAVLRATDALLEPPRQKAARKIALWYRTVAPRRKLLLRLYCRECVRDAIDLILDKTHALVMVRHQRRRLLLRHGAAMKIQRVFRQWVNTVLEEERRVEREERRRAALGRISLLIQVVRNGIRLFRYLRYAIRRKILHRNSTGRPPLSLSRIIDAYCQMYTLHRRFDLQRQIQRRASVDFTSSSERRIQIFRALDSAVRFIQRLVRGYLTRKRMEHARRMTEKHRRVTLFLSRCLGARRKRRMEKLNESAKIIQKWFRGYSARQALFRLVRAGLRLNIIGRRHAAYRALKSQLRRLERPHTVIIHGIRDIWPNMFTSGYVRVNIYVWWNPLLHIVGRQDVVNFLSSKQPQFIYRSAPHKIASEEIEDQENSKHSSRSQEENNQSFGMRALSRLSSRFTSFHAGSSAAGRDRRLSTARKMSEVGADANQSSTTNNSNPHGNHIHNRQASTTSVLSDVSDEGDKHSGSESDEARPALQSFLRTPLPPPSFRGPQQSRANVTILSAVKEGNEKSERSSLASAATATSSKKRLSVLVSPSSPKKRNSILSTASPSSNTKRNSILSTASPSSNSKRNSILSPSVSSSALTSSSSAKRKSIINSSTSDRKRNSIISPAALLAQARSNKKQQQPKPRSDTGRPSRTIKAAMAARKKHMNKNAVLAENEEDEEDEEEEDDEEEEEEDEEGEEDEEENDEDDDDNDEEEDEEEEEEEEDEEQLRKEEEEKERARQVLRSMRKTSIKRPFGFSNAAPVMPESTTMNNTATDANAARPSQASPSKTRITLRQTLNFALNLTQLRKKTEEPSPMKKMRISANFEDEVIKIPGCHGNSAFRFEVVDGERRVGFVNFFLSQQGELLYWGGDYQQPISVASQKRAVQLNSVMLKRTDQERTSVDSPKLDFRIISGAPLRSRCQWGRIVARGKGPLKRALHGRTILSSLSIFNRWHRLFFSLDEFGLFLFENKFYHEPLFIIPISDFISVNMDINSPLSYSTKNVVEDITNIVVKTHSGDELYMRFPDSASRIAWFEVLQNAIDHHAHAANVVATPDAKKKWFADTFFDKKLSVYTRSRLSTINVQAGAAPSEVAKTHRPSLSPLRSKYLSRLLRLRKDEDEEDDDDEDEDDEKKSNLQKAFDSSIGLITNGVFSSSKSDPELPVVRLPKIPPPPVNSPSAIPSKKGRKPPIFSVPFKKPHTPADTQQNTQPVSDKGESAL